MNKSLRGIIHVYCRINGFFLTLLMGGTAGRGVGKVEPGSEKILDVGLNFKIGI